MKIESLKTTPDRAGRYWVTFSDGTKMPLYRQTVEEFGLYSGMELNENEWKRLQSAAGEMSAKMLAIRIVSTSNVSKRDLQQRLVHKGEDPDQARKAIQWMEDLDLLDDRKTAEQIVQRCIVKGYGLARAKQALYEKQIPRHLWDDVLEDYPDQTEAIADFLRNKLGEDWDDKELKRAIDAAMRRGHSYQEIRRALQILQADDDFPEEF
jgi:regulatory protein